jgi:hypothetical protein
MSKSLRVLGERDAVADGEDCKRWSLVVVALRELVGDTELVSVVVAEDVIDATSTAHSPLWQVAPGGQHESPHWSSCAVGVEWSWFPGNNVAFCAVRSQEMGETNLQSWPAGQQRTAIAADSSCRHTADSGQQKSEGKGTPHCCRELSPPHMDSVLLSRPEDIGLDNAAAVTVGNMFETWAITRAIKKVVISMLRYFVVAVRKEEGMQEERTLEDDQDGAKHERGSELVVQKARHWC